MRLFVLRSVYAQVCPEWFAGLRIDLRCLMKKDLRFWMGMAGLLLVVAASRLVRLDDVALNRDEIWSVWQTFGSPQQILQWTPYDWPPLYYLVLGGWRAIMGAEPIVLRVLSSLVFMLGLVFMYRAVRRLHSARAAWLVSLAYAALGFSILLSLEVRGYALLMGLFPLALWLTLRFFDQPGWWRALPLGVALAAMFYTSLTSVGAILVLGIVTLIIYREKVWRWWQPGLIASVLMLPEVLNKLNIATRRVAATQTLELPPLPQALGKMFWEYGGFTFAAWVVLFVLATLMIVWHERRLNARTGAWLVWIFVMPLLMYILNPVLGFFSPRYAWWIMPGIVLWIGWGLAYLPRVGLYAVVVVFVAMLFYPLPRSGQYQIWGNLSPLGENFTWLQDNMQWGDVILENAENTCGAVEEWDYYLGLYFPNGLQFVRDLNAQRRVWVLNPGEQPEELQAMLQQQYIRGRFVGPPGCLFRLYEAPPDREGVLFENGMRFHGVDVMSGRNPDSSPLVRREAERVRLRLWWSVDDPPLLDYSIKTYLAKQDVIHDQIDGPPEVIYPEDAPVETSRWIPGRYYVEERELHLPYPSAGTYHINLVVYFWEDPVPIPVQGGNSDDHLLLTRVRVMSY
jgi:hypothetical protein